MAFIALRSHSLLSTLLLSSLASHHNLLRILVSLPYCWQVVLGEWAPASSWTVQVPWVVHQVWEDPESSWPRWQAAASTKQQRYSHGKRTTPFASANFAVSCKLVKSSGYSKQWCSSRAAMPQMSLVHNCFSQPFRHPVSGPFVCGQTQSSERRVVGQTLRPKQGGDSLTNCSRHSATLCHPAGQVHPPGMPSNKQADYP